MSRIDKMKIRGVRSFGVDEKDTQVIEFEHPLTFIVGKNGTGKTSIIESLRYATTGDMKSGKAFIHYPKLVKTSTATADVKLRFHSVGDEELLVHRKHGLKILTRKNKEKLDDKKKKEELSLVGAEACITDVQTRQVTGSRRLQDVTEDMVRYLGVKKALLENVIFCHQDDSHWPLSTDGVLKEKFDAIFEFKDYKNILESIKKSEKKFDEKLKTENTNCMTFKKFHELYTEKKKDLDYEKRKYREEQENLENIRLEIEKMESIAKNELRNLKQKHKDLQERISKRATLFSEISKEFQNGLPSVSNETEISEKFASDFEKSMTNMVENEEKETFAKEATFKKKIVATENEQQEILSSKIAIEEKVKHNEQKIFEAEKEIQELTSALEKQYLEKERESVETLQGHQSPSFEQLNDWMKTQIDQKLSMEKDLDENQLKLANLSAKFEMHSKFYEEKVQYNVVAGKDLFDLCGSSNFNDILAQCGDTVRRLQKERGLDDGLQNLYKSFSDMLSCSGDVSSTPCPLCHRNFDKISEIRMLSQEINEKLQITSKKQEGCEEKLETELNRFQKLTDFKPEFKELERLTNELPRMKHELDSWKSEIATLRDTIDKNKKNIKKFKNDTDIIESCLNALKQKETLEQSVESLQNSCSELKSQQLHFKQQLQEVNDKKEKLQNDHKREMNEAQKFIQQMKLKLQDVSSLNEDIVIIGKDLRSLSDEISNVFDDFFSLHNDQQANKLFENMKKELEQVKVGTKSVKDLLLLFEDFDKKLDSLEKEEIRLSEQQRGLDRSMEVLLIDLEKDDFRNATENFVSCKQKIVAYELTIQDLKIYIKALDHAIMTYHTEKMSTVNDIIKNIWTRTYKGEDIEHIEICSENDTDSKKHNYRYRVVAIIDGEKLDVRDRCSAGQKVLACLIIRLALAEAFCIDCGIIALDEPTTNLDSGHIESLAESLSDIIEDRQQQENFQLIVITHDEIFAALLGQSYPPSHFFRIVKENGMSRIKKIPFEELPKPSG